LHKLRRTNVIEVDYWAEVANKTANINVQNCQMSEGQTVFLLYLLLLLV